MEADPGCAQASAELDRPSSPVNAFTHEPPPTPPASAPRDTQGSRGRPKRPPTVTPRTFTRFFTPRSSQESPTVSTSRKALRNITNAALNRRNPGLEQGGDRPLISGDLLIHNDTNEEPPSVSPRKRRRLSYSLEGPSPLKQVQSVNHRSIGLVGHGDIARVTPEAIKSFPLPIRRSRAFNVTGGLLSRSIGGTEFHGLRSLPSSDFRRGWQSQTASFSSRPEDSYRSSNLPFCVTSCNTNPLVAVGDEDGYVQLLESAANDDTGFSHPWLTFRPHSNAILDLQFSSDDTLLATASGDQTARVVDMQSQTILYTLSRHASSVKQVRFQPESGDKVIVTSSRDGNVNFWDLRCISSTRPAFEAFSQFDSDEARQSHGPPAKMKWVGPIESIRGGHARARTLKSKQQPPHSCVLSKPEPPLKTREDISITSMEFLRPHILITSSDTNACVKVWDMRISYSRRHGRPVPVSTTRQPRSHEKYREFGVTSMTLGGDGARLYTVCRDNTVYSYSASHMILGSAPELYAPNSRSRRYGDMDNEGLGPLYGFRHPLLHVATFYVKCGLRKAGADKSELLAVGSSDSCAVVFPTDESLLSQLAQTQREKSSDHSTKLSHPRTLRSAASRASSSLKVSARSADAIPIYSYAGTALVAGHEKEVSGVTWTPNGELVTVGDDYRVRCWREGRQASQLRRGGESGGNRWGCGWADVEEMDTDSDDE